MSANKDRLALIEHLSSIPGEYSDDLRETLDRVAFAIASGMEAEVCSLYLFDPQRERIVLRATVGLDRESVGKVSMRLNEGLVGLVLEQDEPVFVPDAISHPRYKYFPETGEERFHTFLGVPVRDGRKKPLGVLVAQTLERRKFNKNEIRLLNTAANQVAQILSHFRLRESLATKEKERLEYKRRMIEANRQLKDYEKVGGKTRHAAPAKIRRPRLAGLSASPGFAQGNAHVVGTFLSSVDRHQKSRDPEGREQALRGGARAFAGRAGDVADSDGTADARVGPQDFRRSSHDPRGRRVRQPHPRHYYQRLHGGELAVPRDRGAERVDARGRGQLLARACDRLPRRRPSRAAASAAGRKAGAFHQADDYRGRRVDALAVDDGQPRQAGGDRAAIGRRHLSCCHPGARVRNPHGGRRRAPDGVGGRGRFARARRQRGRRLRQSGQRDRARLRRACPSATRRSRKS